MDAQAARRHAACSHAACSRASGNLRSLSFRTGRITGGPSAIYSCHTCPAAQKVAAEIFELIAQASAATGIDDSRRHVWDTLASRDRPRSALAANLRYHPHL